MTKPFSAFLLEKGFSTKRSQLKKYIDRANAELRIGWEVEVYTGEEHAAGEREPETTTVEFEEEFMSIGRISENDIGDFLLEMSNELGGNSSEPFNTIKEAFIEAFFDVLELDRFAEKDLDSATARSRLKDEPELGLYTGDDLEDEDDTRKYAAMVLKAGRDNFEDFMDESLVHEFFTEYADDILPEKFVGKHAYAIERVLSQMDRILNQSSTLRLINRNYESYYVSEEDATDQELDRIDVDMDRGYVNIMFYGTVERELESDYDDYGGGSFEAAKRHTEEVIGNLIDDYDIVSDGSLDDDRGGVEIVSGLYQDFEKGLDDLERLLIRLRRNNFEVDSETGIHVSISFKNREMEEKIDWLKHALISGVDRIIDDLGRTDNRYITTFKDQVLPKALERMKFDKPSAKDSVFLRQYNELSKNVLNTLQNKYNYVNLGTMDRNGRIEFRLFGGENMLDEAEQTKIRVHRIIAPLFAAADPEAFKKEYLTRIGKLISGSEGAASKQGIIQVRRDFFETTLAGIMDHFDYKRQQVMKITTYLQSVDPETRANLVATLESDFNPFQPPISDNEEFQRLVVPFQGRRLGGRRYNLDNEIGILFFPTLVKNISRLRDKKLPEPIIQKIVASFLKHLPQDVVRRFLVAGVAALYYSVVYNNNTVYNLNASKAEVINRIEVYYEYFGSPDQLGPYIPILKQMISQIMGTINSESDLRL